MMDLIVDNVQQQVVDDPRVLPKAVMCCRKRSGGICAQRVLIFSVLWSQSRRISSLGRASRVNDCFHSPVTMPRTIGSAMVIISMTIAPKGRIEPIEKLKSWSSEKVSIARRVKRR